MFDFFMNDIVSIKHGENDVTYKMIIPGVDKKDISVSVSNSQLMVETKKDTAFGQKFGYCDECNYGKYYDVSGTKSTLVNGVLTITIPAKKYKKQDLHVISID